MDLRLVLARTLGVSAALAACLAGASSASAASSGGGGALVSEGLTVAPPPVRSVTVSPSSVSCTPALTFPNGRCTTPAITVTNGSAASHITVHGDDAIPSSGTPNWSLCDSITCKGGDGYHPGIDQFSNSISAPTINNNSDFLDISLLPDYFFGTAGAATPGQTVAETSTVIGPAASTNPSLSFSTFIVWTAGP